MSICHKKSCPICKQKLINKTCEKIEYEESKFKCPNSCYSYKKLKSDSRTYIRVSVFNKQFTISIHHHRDNKLSRFKDNEELALKEINYWKENDRYLMHFLQ